MSEMVAPPVWAGPVLGGLALASVSTAGSFIVEKEAPKTKSILRDFLLGAVLMVLIMQILPESTAKLILSIVAFTGLTSKATQSGGGDTAEASGSSLLDMATGILKASSSEGVPTSESKEEYEVRVGIPRF